RGLVDHRRRYPVLVARPVVLARHVLDRQPGTGHGLPQSRAAVVTEPAAAYHDRLIAFDLHAVLGVADDVAVDERASRAGREPYAVAAAVPHAGTGQRGLAALLHRHAAGPPLEDQRLAQVAPAKFADEDADVVAAADPRAVPLGAATAEAAQRRNPGVGDLRLLEAAPPVVGHHHAVSLAAGHREPAEQRVGAGGDAHAVLARPDHLDVVERA